MAASVMGDGGLKGPFVFCLYGNLGAGKTTFTQGFAGGLGIQSRLLSPTFIIVRRYPVPKTPGFLYHIDLYRLQSPGEIGDLGISEILQDRESYVVIEWAERLGNAAPSKRTDISFSLTGEGRHRIEIAAF
jgi:tRNA threonylcarbamoyladenosine biosynthesis protein TsaE